MNIKLISLSLFMSSFTIHTNSTQVVRREKIDHQDVEAMLQALCEPVKTTSSGFTLFLEKTYNDPLYAQEILPNNFSHVMQFLEHGKKNKQTKAYIQSVVRLFGNRLKASSYVNAYAFGDFLEQLPVLLDGFFLVQRPNAHHLLQDKINTLLYERFKNNFSAFQHNPSDFFNTLTQDILDALSVEHQELGEISSEELRKSVLVFLEVGLSKLIWSPEDQLETWNCVKTISERLTMLMDCNVLSDPDDLNGLFVTLLERYCFFLDLAGADLSPEFYQNIKHDISSSSLLLLELEEQELLIESKRNRLKSVLEQAEKKAHALVH